MRDMKDSGIEWIGYIPNNWLIIPIKYHFKINRGRVISILDLDDDGNYPVYSSQTENDGCLGYLKTYDYSGPSITWTTDGAKAGTVFYRDGKYNCTNVCGILQLREHYKKKSNMHFLAYAIGMVAEQNKRYDINGYKIMSNEMAKIKFAIPSIQSQTIISNFLDRKCSEIDALRLEIEKEIATLKEYKKSIITEAVTKGLNKNVPMKDSGIKYVGIIPKSWNIHPVYYYFVERKNKNTFGLETNLLSLSYGNIIHKDINTTGGLLPESFNTYNIVEPYDIIIRPTDLQNDKRSLRTGLVREHGIITSAYIALKASKKIHIPYFHYLLHAFDVMKVFYNMGNGVRQGLNFSEFSKLMVFEPPQNEQKQIADYLDRKCYKIDDIIEAKNKQLSTLDEYKKSLIYEYVTGKKEVPGV